eukprot:15112278-Alexandrium_andersonii.AAC.1
MRDGHTHILEACLPVALALRGLEEFHHPALVGAVLCIRSRARLRAGCSERFPACIVVVVWPNSSGWF